MILQDTNEWIASFARAYLAAEDRYRAERFGTNWAELSAGRDNAWRDLRVACGMEDVDD